MTTINFTPNNSAAPPFQTTVTLDGNSYNLTAMWNFYSSRWYVSISDQSGNLICNQPLIGSPPSGAAIPLFPGHFTASTIYYYPGTETFVTNP